MLSRRARSLTPPNFWTQTFPHSTASADATTQLPLTEFFLGCIYSKDRLKRLVPPPTHAHAHSASLPQPSDNATIYSPSSTSRTSDRLHSAPPPPPGLEDQAHLSSSHGIPLIAAPVRLQLLRPPPFRPCSRRSVPPKWEHMLIVHQLPTRGVQVPPSGNPQSCRCRSSCGTWTFSKASGRGSLQLILCTVASCITNTVSQFFSGTQAQRAGTPPISLRRPVEDSMRLFFKKPVITSPHLRSVHCGHWQHGPRHFAQQGHLRA